MSQPEPSPIDAALDLFVYAPVGLALTLGEELPKLAAKGRERLQIPLGNALVLGRFAAAQGRREVDRRWNGSAPTPSRPTPAPAPEPDDAPSTHVPVTAELVREEAPPAEPGPDATSLAIPGYDSLSASQVVQRLAGLSGPELEAVGAYEATHRGRRTILTRVAQLQAH